MLREYQVDEERIKPGRHMRDAHSVLLLIVVDQVSTGKNLG
jgi:hypothetical protein